MRSRFSPSHTYTAQTVTSKLTGMDSVSLSSPITYFDQLTVLQDQLHGDRKSVYPHEFRKLTFSDYVGEFVRDGPTEVLKQTGYIASFTHYVDAHPANWDNLYNSALSKMYEQLRSGGFGSGLDLSVDLAEAHQVKKMIKDSLKLVNFIRSFHPKQWANRWLEYQYGWKPLVSSVYSTFDALMRRRLYSLQKVQGQRHDSFIDRGRYDDLHWAGSTEITQRESSLRCRIGCYFRTKNDVSEQLSGFTSLNPVSIAWELLPYSFVVDWFVDVGSFLRNMESALLYSQDFVSGYKVFGFHDRQIGQLYGGKTVGDVTTFGGAKAYILQSYKLRIPIMDYPLPALPSFEANLGWQRLLSGASLLSQHWGK